MRSLMFTPGSPYARAVRVILDELELVYEGHEPEAAPAAQQLGTATPTMQVPTLRDGEVTLWESATIAARPSAQEDPLPSLDRRYHRDRPVR